MQKRNIISIFLILIFSISFIPSVSAQSNPCDEIESSDTITVGANDSPDQLQLVLLERAIVNSYLEGVYDFALVIIDEMLNVDEEYGLAYFYQGCIQLALGEADEAETAFASFIEFAGDEDEALVEAVEAFLTGDETTDSPDEDEDSSDEAGELVLSSYGEGGEAVMNELEILGLFPSGSDLLFTEDFISYTSDGIQFNSYVTSETRENYVMGATLSFSPEGRDLQFCGIIGHAVRDDGYTFIRLTEFLFAGLDSAGTVFLLENLGEDGDPLIEVTDVQLDLDEAVQITALVFENQASIYANGEVVIENLEITGGSGSFSFYILSQDPSTRCQAEDIFGYALPEEYVAEGCFVSSNTNVNRRTGPGTNFDRDGQLQAGQSLEVVGQALDDGGNGLTWWELEDGAWVREDVVNVDGYCRTLPVTSEN